MGELWRRLLALVRPKAIDHDLSEELRFHANMKAREMGDHPAAARAIGPALLWRERARDAWGWRWLDDLAFDVRHAGRLLLRRDRAFSLAGIAMLALAIGLNLTVFTIVQAMLFRGFPLVPRNDRLLYIQVRYPSGKCCSYSDFEAWRAGTHAFQDLAFVVGRQATIRAGMSRPIEVHAMALSANAFEVLGVHPMLGRDFVPPDEAPGAPIVVILSNRFWERQFASRPDIVGSTVEINGAPGSVIGVMPAGVEFPGHQDLWMAASTDAASGYFVFGRLRDGATREQARAELDTIDRRLEATFPAAHRGATLAVDDYSRFFIGPDATIIYGCLWAGAWLVLVIACGNLAQLALARTIGRSREFATRVALGAGLLRMVRQILLESMMLAVIAGVLGWGMTVWSVRTWSIATEDRFVVLDYHLNAATVAYLVGIVVIAAVLCALAPIVRVVHLGVDGALHGDARGATQGQRAKGWTAGLVVSQMALAIILLCGAGVLVRSLFNIVHAQTGVPDPEHILVGAAHLPADRYPTAADRLAFIGRLEARLRALPAIAGEAVAGTIPGNGTLAAPLEIEGRRALADDDASVSWLAASPGYFDVIDAPLIAGRDFKDSDRADGLPVAIVNERFAATFWPGEAVVGQHLRLMRPNAPGEWRTVVGVAPNIRQDVVRQAFRPIVYLPVRQEPAVALRGRSLEGVGFDGTWFLLRTKLSPQQVARTVQSAVDSLDPDVTVRDLGDLKATFAFHRGRMDLEHAELGKNATVAPILAAIALLLAIVGLYAVIAHSVSQRTKEIGIRIAIGAESADIRRLIVREGMLPVIWGMAAGLPASLAVNRLLQSQLIGVSPYDARTLLGAPLMLTIVAAIACRIPARRAMRVDPVVALRHE